MAYTKQTWETGDIITAEKLNHMEDGIYTAKDDNNFIITLHFDYTDHEYHVDKTIAEINEAFTEGKELKLDTGGGLYLTFKGHETSMIGDTYTFTGITMDPTLVGASQVNVYFITCNISDNQIQYISKTAPITVSG